MKSVLLLLAAASAAVAWACKERTPEPPVVLEASSVDGRTHLKLVAAAGIRINARLKPALELPGGRVLRFDSPDLTPDSSYFKSPPTAELTGLLSDLGGTLRASICEAEEDVCRTVEIAQ